MLRCLPVACARARGRAGRCAQAAGASGCAAACKCAAGTTVGRTYQTPRI